MSSLPEREQFRDAAPPRLLVAVPAIDGAQPPSSLRWVAITAVVLGLLLAVSVAVVALVDRGHGTSHPGRTHGVAAPSKNVVLPVVIGAGVQLATTTLQGEGFPVQVRTVSAGSPAGTVVGEKPSGGRPVARSTRVLLTVSNG